MKKSTFKPLILVLAVAVVLIGFGGVGATRALVNVQGSAHSITSRTQAIHVDILENGTSVSSGALFADILSEDENLLLNKAYADDIDIINDSDSIDAYVRVVIKKYWSNENGKNTAVDPSMIKIDYADGWNVVNVSAEETILYYPTIVKTGQTIDLANAITIDGQIASKVTEEATGATTSMLYAYDGYDFTVEMTVNAVQTHNGADAILASWGVDPASVGISVVADEDLEVIK